MTASGTRIEVLVLGVWCSGSVMGDWEANSAHPVRLDAPRVKQVRGKPKTYQNVVWANAADLHPHYANFTVYTAWRWQQSDLDVLAELAREALAAERDSAVGSRRSIDTQRAYRAATEPKAILALVARLRAAEAVPIAIVGGPLTEASEQVEAEGAAPAADTLRSVRCPCCKGASKRRDVWYDCPCFQGGKKSCATCKLPKTEKDGAIAATIRAWGWDKNPSPGMRDYLTPGWREPVGHSLPSTSP